jgi:hypothetical protein
MTTHRVVCHDCPFERLVEDDGQQAAEVKSHHAVAEGHNVEYLEVA